MASARVFTVLLLIATTSAQSSPGTPNFQEMFQNMMNALSSMAPPLELPEIPEYPEEEEGEEEDYYSSWFGEGKSGDNNVKMFEEEVNKEVKDSDAEEYVHEATPQINEN